MCIYAQLYDISNKVIDTFTSTYNFYTGPNFLREHFSQNKLSSFLVGQ